MEKREGEKERQKCSTKHTLYVLLESAERPWTQNKEMSIAIALV